MKPASFLKVAFMQANPTVGAIKANIELVKAKAVALKGYVDLLVTSECFGVGYPVQDLVMRPGFVRDFEAELQKLAEFVRELNGPAILIGGPESSTTLPYNAMFLIYQDGSIKVTRKHHLANSEVYDEKRTFSEGPLPVPFNFLGWKLGVPICEDFWHGDVSRALQNEDADIIIVPNGSHFKAGKQDTRVDRARHTVMSLNAPLVYLNQIGGQDELVFDGGSFVMERHGQYRGRAAFQEDTFIVRFERHDNIVSADVVDKNGHADLSGSSYPERLSSIYSAMVLGLRDYIEKNKFPGVVIGMSGGIDSALSAVIAVDALGPEKVTLVRMPSRFTSDISMNDAEEASRRLGTTLETISIADVVDSFQGALSPLLQERMKGVTSENLQARARGTILMGISNATGLMVLSTGNKSEMSVGYATLYGDMCGGYSVLKDIWKTDVFALSRWRNEHKSDIGFGPCGEVMPVSIIDRPPTAELAEGQTDEASLGSYDVLDAVLKNVIENQMDALMASRQASQDLGYIVTLEQAERITKLAWRAEYKRRQAPPGVAAGDSDYSRGWRLPITNHYGL